MGLLERCSLLLLDYILLMLVQTSSFPMKICHGGTSWHNTGRFLVHCSPCWWCGGSLPLGMAQSNAHLGDSPLARASHCIMPRTNLYTALPSALRFQALHSARGTLFAVGLYIMRTIKEIQNCAPISTLYASRQSQYLHWINKQLEMERLDQAGGPM